MQSDVAVRQLTPAGRCRSPAVTRPRHQQVNVVLPREAGWAWPSLRREFVAAGLVIRESSDRRYPADSPETFRAPPNLNRSPRDLLTMDLVLSHVRILSQATVRDPRSGVGDDCCNTDRDGQNSGHLGIRPLTLQIAIGRIFLWALPEHEIHVPRDRLGGDAPPRLPALQCVSHWAREKHSTRLAQARAGA
jgi:hypothetical protein